MALLHVMSTYFQLDSTQLEHLVGLIPGGEYSNLFQVGVDLVIGTLFIIGMAESHASATCSFKMGLRNGT